MQVEDEINTTGQQINKTYDGRKLVQTFLND